METKTCIQDSLEPNTHLAEVEQNAIKNFRLIRSCYKNDNTEKLANVLFKHLRISFKETVKTEIRAEISSSREDLKNFGIPRKFHVKFINKEIGLGVFVNENNTINEGELIGVYEGVMEFSKELNGNYNYYLLDNTKINKKIKNSIKNSENIKNKLKESEEYSILSGKGKTYFILDAKEQGNFTRFINHSNSEANCVTDIEIVDKTLTLVITATQVINPGEQVLLNYGNLFWNSLNKSDRVDLKPTTYILKNGHIQEGMQEGEIAENLPENTTTSPVITELHEKRKDKRELDKIDGEIESTSTKRMCQNPPGVSIGFLDGESPSKQPANSDSATSQISPNVSQSDRMITSTSIDLADTLGSPKISAENAIFSILSLEILFEFIKSNERTGKNLKISHKNLITNKDILNRFPFASTNELNNFLYTEKISYGRHIILNPDKTYFIDYHDFSELITTCISESSIQVTESEVKTAIELTTIHYLLKTDYFNKTYKSADYFSKKSITVKLKPIKNLIGFNLMNSGNISKSRLPWKDHPDISEGVKEIGPKVESYFIDTFIYTPVVNNSKSKNSKRSRVNDIKHKSISKNKIINLESCNHNQEHNNHIEPSDESRPKTSPIQNIHAQTSSTQVLNSSLQKSDFELVNKFGKEAVDKHGSYILNHALNTWNELRYTFITENTTTEIEKLKAQDINRDSFLKILSLNIPDCQINDLESICSLFPNRLYKIAYSNSYQFFEYKNPIPDQIAKLEINKYYKIFEFVMRKFNTENFVYIGYDCESNNCFGSKQNGLLTSLSLEDHDFHQTLRSDSYATTLFPNAKISRAIHETVWDYYYNSNNLKTIDVKNALNFSFMNKNSEINLFNYFPQNYKMIVTDDSQVSYHWYQDFDYKLNK